MHLRINNPQNGCNVFIGDCSHPGGLALTQLALNAVEIKPRGFILDVGCGRGETLLFLQQQGYKVAGLDLRWNELRTAVDTGTPVFQADWLNLPLRTKSVDAVFAECTFSLIQNLDGLLGEIFEVLCVGGSLVFNGLYVRNLDASRENLDNCLQAVKTQPQLEHALFLAGLDLCYWQDQSEVLRSMSLTDKVFCWQRETFSSSVSQSISNRKLDAFERFLAVDQLKLGYYVAVAKKRKD